MSSEQYDATLSTDTDVLLMEKYVIPAKRRDKGNQIVTASSMHKQSTTMTCLASEAQVL